MGDGFFSEECKSVKERGCSMILLRIGQELTNARIDERATIGGKKGEHNPVAE